MQKKFQKEGKLRGLADPVSILGLIVGVILVVSVLLPVTMDTVAEQTDTNSATNESIRGVFASASIKTTNVTANEAACAGEFTFGNIFAYNRSNTTAAYQLLSTPANYTAYTNGTIFWNNVAGANTVTGDAGNFTNVTYSCYVQDISPETVTILDILQLLIAVGALLFIAKIALGGGR